MSKNGKDQNDDFYSGEQINYEDYYLDDEDDYLDDDLDDHVSGSISGKTGGESEAGAKTEEIDQIPGKSDEGKKRTEVRRDIDVIQTEQNAGKMDVNESLTNPDAAKREMNPKIAGADVRRNTGKQHQAAGGMKGDLEIRSQEDMKNESAKSSDIKRKDPGKKDGQEKSGAQKSSAEKNGTSKRNTGKTGVQKSNAAKSGPQKDNAAKSGPPKSGTERSGAKRSSPQNPKGSGRGRKAKKSGATTALIAAGVIIGVFVAAYIGVSTYFMNHFYMNTEINGHDFSMKTTADVKEYMEQQVQGYTLTIREKDNKTDSISGEDISLAYKENKDIENVLKKQNAFLWPQAFFIKNSSKATVDVSYDRDALEEQIENLQAVKTEQIPPTSAYPKFNGTEYDVEPEVTGTEVNKEMLREKIHQYISEFEPELDMEAEQCYALPKYTSDSGDVRAACNEMNQYLKASITYSMDQPVVVDKTLISNWVSADENMKVTFNEGAVREWLREFGKQYDTVGKTRTITSPWGKTVEVSGGTYGWSVDEDAEFPVLLNSIKNGEVVTKEPIYVQTAASRGAQDWGSTYAEVDLSGQHMWYIVDGAVALETDVVTGYPSPDKETPSGVYSILEKEPNSILKGEFIPGTNQREYETMVRFWMRVTWSGIGFHDADWQPAFGGTLYTSIGSHGCINMPVDKAGDLYNMMPVGTPVIIHY